MENDSILSDSAISSFVFISNFFTIITIIFGILSVLVILRYSNRSMSEYRFFLLNISLSIFFADMCLSLLYRPYILYPVMGICMVGLWENLLIDQFGREGAIKIMFVIEYFFAATSVASITNATLHRFAQTTKFRAQAKGLLYNKHFLKFVMILLEIVWPLIGCLLCLQALSTSVHAFEENLEINSKVTQRSVHHACFLRSQNVVRALQTIYPTILSFSHLALCATASTFIVIFCWIQITKAQKAAMSSRTIKMEKQLMFSLGIQSFIPNIIFLICLGVLLLCLLIGRSWMGTVVSVIFRIASTHTVANFVIMVSTIPAFRRGIYRDFRRYIFRNSTDVRLFWVNTSSSRI